MSKQPSAPGMIKSSFMTFLRKCWQIVSPIRWAKHWRQYFVDRDFDRVYGVDTAGIIPQRALQALGSNQRSAIHYESTDETKLREMLSALPPLPYPEYTFLDLGCAKGKVMLLVAEQPWKSVRGFEFARSLVDVAEANFARYRGPLACRDLSVTWADAAVAELP